MRNVSESNDGEKDVADSMIEIVGCSLSTILQSENKGKQVGNPVKRCARLFSSCEEEPWPRRPQLVES